MKNQQTPTSFLGGSKEKENELIAEMAQEVRHIVESLKEPENNGVRRRAQHAKMLAGIKNAEFRVSPNIPEDLRVGFLQPNAICPAIIRFSNAIGFIRDDDSENRANALKL